MTPSNPGNYMTADSHRCQTIIGFAPTAAVGCAVFFLAGEERPTCFFPYLTPLNYLIARSEGMAIRSREAAAGKRESDAHIRDVPGRSPAQEIAHTKELLDAGTITQAEFDSLKAKALR